jgi:hypothetical protein
MALTCPTDLTGVDIGFSEFLDCATLTINYDPLGQATLNFTVVAALPEPISVQAYTDLVFGGIRFTGFITSLEVRRITGTIVYEHRYTLSAVGCRI